MIRFGIREILLQSDRHKLETIRKVATIPYLSPSQTFMFCVLSYLNLRRKDLQRNV